MTIFILFYWVALSEAPGPWPPGRPQVPAGAGGGPQ